MKILINLFAGFYFLAAMACVRGAKSRDAETVRMVINHYLVPCTGSGAQLCYLAKIDGSTEWEFLFEGIDDFEYEWGNVYQLVVEKRSRKSPKADQAALSYRLVSILNTKSAHANELFPLRLKDGDMVSIRKDVNGQFSLMDQYPVSCASASLCLDLERRLQSGTVVTGLFQHSPDHKSIILQSFKN